MGGIAWDGLGLVMAMLGLTDVEDLMHRLIVIKTHEPPKATDQ